MLNNSYEKHPDARKIISQDFSLELATDETIESATAVIREYKTGTDVSDTLLQEVRETYTGGIVTLEIKNGDDGQDYEILITATSSLALEHTASIMLRVRSN